MAQAMRLLCVHTSAYGVGEGDMMQWVKLYGSISYATVCHEVLQGALAYCIAKTSMRRRSLRVGAQNSAHA